jgi:hypothetical protein
VFEEPDLRTSTEPWNIYLSLPVVQYTILLREKKRRRLTYDILHTEEKVYTNKVYSTLRANLSTYPGISPREAEEEGNREEHKKVFFFFSLIRMSTHPCG